MKTKSWKEIKQTIREYVILREWDDKLEYMLFYPAKLISFDSKQQYRKRYFEDWEPIGFKKEKQAQIYLDNIIKKTT